MPAPSKPAEYQPEQPPASSVPSQPATPPGSGTNETSCPPCLNSTSYQFPHLIIPISSTNPSSAPGTSYNGQTTSSICSLFNFDVPQLYSGHTCTLAFLFPTQADLETSSYNISGAGGIEFSRCETPASEQISWDTKGKCDVVKTVESVAPGNEYTIVVGACTAGMTVTYEMCATGTLGLGYFQDYNTIPIRLYYRKC